MRASELLFLLILPDATLGLSLKNRGNVQCGNTNNIAVSLSSRRFFFYHASIISSLVIPNSSLARENESQLSSSQTVPVQQQLDQQQRRKPSAPLEALLPATRCKIWVDESYSISSTLASSIDNNKYDILLQLNKLLSSSPRLFIGSEKLAKQKQAGKISFGATSQMTTNISSANKEQYQRNRADLPMANKVAAMLNQADVERQYGILRYQQSKMDNENEYRAAFNYYTSQLQFSSDSYVLTAQKEEKKRMIRDDQLPTLTTVIVSDLDLRDLYRNEFLTAIEDVKAEVSYQLRQSSASSSKAIDIDDVVELMNQAYTACTKWFDLIPENDVREAMDVVLKEL